MNIESTSDPRRARTVAAVIAAILIAGSSLDLARAADAPRSGGKASKPETAGVVSGLAVGAAAGGPIGAILGAAGGAWLGDRWHRQQESNRSLSGNLTKERDERARLTAEIAQLTTALTDMEAAVGNQAAEFDALRAGSIPLDELNANVHFRTRDTQLTPDDYQALRQLGAALAARTERTVYVSGFADARGASGYNFELSTARAESVADALVEGGLPRGQLVVAGLGPRNDGDCLTDVDSCAFQRRVAVSMLPLPANTDESELAQVQP
jgi:outer membrane protein OmpA-like peptidoglycan-associated protein